MGQSVAYVLLVLTYLSVSIGLLIFLIDAVRRSVRALEQMAATGERQAQTLEVLADKLQASCRETNASDGNNPIK